MLNTMTIQGYPKVIKEKKVTDGGKVIKRFKVEVFRPFKNNAGEYDSDTIQCIAWGENAEMAERYIKEGRLITVGGRMQVRTTNNTRSGDRITFYELVVSSFETTAPIQREETLVTARIDKEIAHVKALIIEHQAEIDLLMVDATGNYDELAFHFKEIELFEGELKELYDKKKSKKGA